jgi:uncharacterized protein
MPPERNPAVDMVRALALIGIAVVNLPFMALPLHATLTLPDAGPDRIAVLMVELLFQAKFFLLFSFIFGWGMEIQTRSAARTGASFARRFSRRLAMLALIGILHAHLVFVGDILLLYALLGLVAWAAKRASVRALLAMAAGLVPVAALCLVLIGTAFADVPLPPAEPNPFVFLLLFQSHLALAAFLTGIAAARSGFFDAGNAAADRLKRAVPFLLITGLAVNAVYVLGNLAGEANPALALLGLASLAVGGPILAAAYLGLILRAARVVRLPAFASLAGRNSMTCYVLQGCLAGLIFGGYGLGLFGSLGPLALLPLSLGVALLSMVLVAAFARRFGHGPLELILRRVTYA